MSDGEHVRLAVSVNVGFGEFELKVEFNEPLQGIIGLFGPSGSGKSTLLRIVAGLETEASGTVRCGQDCWQDSKGGVFVRPHRRSVGYVFQHARLFPHLSVEGNLDYADRRGATDRPSASKQDIIGAMNIDALLARDVRSLSGGERQRVAIARTLLTRPSLLLFDEPLASLDVGARNDILPYLESLNARFGIPAIYVSHAVEEMARLADRVILLNEGRIDAIGSASAILGRESLRPASLPFEPVTILAVTVTGHLEALHLTQVEHQGQVLTVPELRAEQGTRLRLAVRASDVVLSRGEPGRLSVRNVLDGTVTNIEGDPESAFVLVSVDVGGALLKARITQHAVLELQLEKGVRVRALIKTAIFDRGL